MKIHWKKEIYLVSVNNTSYSRINGEWHSCSGGSPLDWHLMKNNDTTISLEKKFVKKQRKEKLKQIGVEK